MITRIGMINVSLLFSFSWVVVVMGRAGGVMVWYALTWLVVVHSSRINWLDQWWKTIWMIFNMQDKENPRNNSTCHTWPMLVPTTLSELLTFMSNNSINCRSLYYIPFIRETNSWCPIRAPTLVSNLHKSEKYPKRGIIGST